tara:strand:- start:2366 stop:2896 length:531 start_codon:yes stop_codon:yes gene_type:complete
MSINLQNKKGLILVGHGGIPSDCPSELIQNFMALHKKREAQGVPPTKLELGLEKKIRSWPRTSETDPYQAGLESLACHLLPLLEGWSLKTAYNEFCEPSIEEAAENLISDGVKEIFLVTTMITPGGSHSELEIPAEVEKIRNKYPSIKINYAWPFDLNKVASLISDQVKSFSKSTD